MAIISGGEDGMVRMWDAATGQLAGPPMGAQTDLVTAVAFGRATNYPLLLPGEAALGLPGAAENPGYPLALAVSAAFASYRADVAGTEELCRRAADANARRGSPDWRVEEATCAVRATSRTPLARSPTPPASPNRKPASPGRARP